MPAAEAHRWGVVNEVVPAAELMAAARRWADAIMECAPFSVWASKESALAGLHLSLNDAINKRYEYLLGLEASEDTREGPPRSGRSASLSGGHGETGNASSGGRPSHRIHAGRDGPDLLADAGDFGADIMKIERRDVGEIARGKIFEAPGESPPFLS